MSAFSTWTGGEQGEQFTFETPLASGALLIYSNREKTSYEVELFFSGIGRVGSSKGDRLRAKATELYETLAARCEAFVPLKETTEVCKRAECR